MLLIATVASSLVLKQKAGDREAAKKPKYRGRDMLLSYIRGDDKHKKFVEHLCGQMALLVRADIDKGEQEKLRWQQTAFADLKKAASGNIKMLTRLLTLWAKFKLVVDDDSVIWLSKVIADDKFPQEARVAATRLAGVYTNEIPKYNFETLVAAETVYCALVEGDFPVRYAAARTPTAWCRVLNADPLWVLLVFSVRLEAMKQGVDPYQNYGWFRAYIPEAPRIDPTNRAEVERLEKWFFANWQYMERRRKGLFINKDRKREGVPWLVWYQRMSRKKRKEYLKQINAEK